MSINDDNKKLTAIFKDCFEPGSDGKNGSASVVVRPESASSTSLFVGIINIIENKPELLDLGGGRFTLSLKNPNISLDEYNGTRVSIRGVQAGGAILNAVLSRAEKMSSSISTINKKSPELLKLVQATKEFLNKYQSVKGLLSARPGFKFINGTITKQFAIVAVVEKKIHLASLSIAEKLPNSFQEYDVEVIPASPMDLLKNGDRTERALLQSSRLLEPTFLEGSINESNTENAVLEAAKIGNGYIPPTNVALEEVTDAMTLLCHISPEGGWKSLGPFLEDVNDHLQLAIYDVSAPHIYKSLKGILENGASLKMVYDGNAAAGVGKGEKVDDKTEEFIIRNMSKAGKKNFQYIKAWKGSDGICNNAYHIKVAVKDKKSFWLSSGNLQTSNQPNVDFESDITLTKDFNREWNVILENKKLAEIYYKFIDWDFTRSSEKPESEEIESALFPVMYVPEELEARHVNQLQLFPPQKFVFTKSNPLRIQPILTPDNYIEHAMDIISSAQTTLYFQNQYINIGQTISPEYEDLLTTLRDKINEIDGRIILRSMFTDDDKKMLEALQAFDFDMSKVKLMKNTHTKGIIADGKRIILGSHNWSNAGVQYNRDASLLIYNEGISKYYEKVFLHDWSLRTKQPRNEEAVILGDNVTESVIIDNNLVPVDWSEYFS